MLESGLSQIFEVGGYYHWSKWLLLLSFCKQCHIELSTYE